MADLRGVRKFLIEKIEILIVNLIGLQLKNIFLIRILRIHKFRFLIKQVLVIHVYQVSQDPELKFAVKLR
jgi:hypothetical protein